MTPLLDALFPDSPPDSVTPPRSPPSGAWRAVCCGHSLLLTTLLPSTRSLQAVPSYKSLGVHQLINGRGAYTVLGGSLMLPQVVQAMQMAAGCQSRTRLAAIQNY